MPAFNNILLCVDQVDPDHQFLKFISNFIDLKKEENYNLSCKIFLHEPDNNSAAKVPQNLKRELESIFFSNENHPLSLLIEIIPQQEDFIYGTLKFASQNNIDLIIIKFSEKNQEEAYHITRSSACSVLLMSSILPEKLEKILVPIDFSAYSKIALETAIAFAKNQKLKIFISHIFFVPEGYLSLGKSYDEMAGMEKNNAKKEYQDFMREFNLMAYHLFPNFILDDDKDPTDKIYKEALEKEVDLIIMSSKGKTASGSEILGNTAKALILYDRLIPILILKNKKENADIADYIWKTSSID